MYSQDEIEAAGLNDFRVFLRQIWDYLALPNPTPLQNDIAKNLQHGPKRFIICGFRGVAKTWITAAFVLWLLFLDPQLKILVVSANENLAKDIIRFMRRLIDGVPLLQHLAPRQGQVDHALAFEVGPANDSKDPSVKAAGITGQITGNRADVIIADDIEVPKNSKTHLLREGLAELVKEFDAILKPLPDTRIIYLGTPQNEASIYPRLVSRGYTLRIWPAEIPERPEVYGDRLAEYVTKRIEAGWPARQPLEPTRFSRAILDDALLSYGASGYALQFMLNTVPSDVEKHPLKTKDLIIHDLDAELGHVKLVWGSTHVDQELQSGGFDGDFYVTPAWKSEEMVKYQGTFCWVDPSGRGADETAYAVVSYLNGMVYLRAVGGYTAGFEEPTLRGIAAAMIRHRVNYWCAEENYGGGMFAQLLKPVLHEMAQAAKAPTPSYDEEYNAWSSSQKELRILDTLQPVMASHRLVVDRAVIEADLRQQLDEPRYSFIQQMTRIARIRGSLPNEDRLEAVAGATAYWTSKMNRDASKALETYQEDKKAQALKDFLNSPIHGGRSANSRRSAGPSMLPRRR